MSGIGGRFELEISGAVAPMFALILFVLVAMAGIGFDYGRLATLSSELKNAADQAALAAATQLDGAPDARQRAEDAARNTFASVTSAYVNETRIANDDEGRPITELTFKFYDGYDNATDEPGSEATDDAEAKVVEVTATGRRVYYALTPVVGAFTSGDVSASAMAGLEKAVCRAPPMMICTDRSDFPMPADQGKGMLLRSLPNNNVDPLAPGNFGFLDLYSDPFGPHEMGENTDYDDCGKVEDVQTQPGFRASQADAINTRFDMYPSNLSCQAGEPRDFCPAEGVRKNYVVTETITLGPTDTPTAPPAPACGAEGVERNLAGGKPAWTFEPAVANFKLDNCFASGTCTYLGDGIWDINSYLAAHHPGENPSDFAGWSRYEIYLWELEDKATRLAPKRIGGPVVETKEVGNSGRYRHTYTSRCAYATPLPPTVPIEATENQRDRRIITVAAVQCEGLAGRDPVSIRRWVDLFLLDPATKSGSEELGTIATEIIGPAVTPDGEPGFQYYGRGRAVLIR